MPTEVDTDGHRITRRATEVRYATVSLTRASNGDTYLTQGDEQLDDIRHSSFSCTCGERFTKDTTAKEHLENVADGEDE